MTETMKKRIVMIVSFVLIGIIAVVLIVGNVFCGLYKNIITQYLCGFGLDENSQQSVAARESGNALAAQVAEEGVVLLKNNGGLPLKNYQVNVFGWSSSDSGFIPQGTGSGTGSRNDLVTFLGGLKEAGITYNEKLAKAYEDLKWRRFERTNGNYVIEAYSDELYKEYYGVYEAPKSFYTDSLMADAKEFSDTAVVVLGRILGEGNDYSHKQYKAKTENDDTRKLQALSVEEEDLLNLVCDNFDQVIVVLNTANPMELGFVQNNDKIDAVLFMGFPGTRGTIGVGKVLTGEVNPSGRVTDTWAYDLSTAPSYVNSGREGTGSYKDISADETLGTRINKYSDYAEDIYIGYKWYETADAEGYFANESNAYGTGYDAVVQYPFGYGLSYTDFKWTLTGFADGSGNALDDGDTLAQDGKIVANLLVENIGKREGKDVIELYYTPPYKKGGIEKSEVNLAAFAKTALLKPGQVEQVKLEFNVGDMKSYDCYDRNNNGFMGYELEGGNYTVSLRTDAHNLAKTANADGRNSITLKVPDSGYRYETDNGTKVENRFTTYTNPVSGASSVINEPAAKKAHSIDGGDEDVKITYMTRADFAGTFPKAKLSRNAGSLKDDTLYVLKDPKTDSSDVAPKTGSKDTNWQITDVMGLKYEDPKWDELVSQLTISQMGELIVRAGFGTIEIDSIGKKKTVDADGPAGFNNSVTGDGGLKAVNYPSPTILASTWDWYMAYQVGRAIGIEGKALGLSGWYGPGANLHRSPTGGRNFEYYSEDAYLSGIIGAYHVYGAKEQGVTAYVKHIAVNDCESGRNGAYKWLTEQNLRENYLKPFEYIVKVGKGNGMMSSVDRVGSTRASGSYAMLTSVLRDEWGFRGTVITDYYQCAHNGAASSAGDIIHDVDECVRAGNSQILYTEGSINWFDDSKSATSQKAIFKSAKDILFSYADAIHFAETAQGLEKGSLIGESVDVFAWWIPVLVAVDVVVAGVMGLWAFLVIRKVILKKEPAAQKQD